MDREELLDFLYESESIGLDELKGCNQEGLYLFKGIKDFLSNLICVYSCFLKKSPYYNPRTFKEDIENIFPMP